MTTLYLTPDEIRNIFGKLPSSIQNAWKSSLKEEDLMDHFETDEEIERKLVTGTKRPSKAVQTFMKQIAEKGEFPSMTPETVEALADVVGAVGLSAVLTAAFQEGVEEGDLDGISALSEMRHRILAANAA